mgnify:CR=1 FL=1
MTKTLALTALLTVIAAAGFSQKRFVQNAHIGVLYPISSNGAAAGEYTNRFSLHILSGVSRNERGLSVSGLVNVIKDSATGLQAAGISNRVGKAAQGLQLAGIINDCGSLSGLQVGGIFNRAGNGAGGAQVAGLINTAQETGLQMAGWFNRATHSKLQIAGLVNKASGATVQVAGLVNIAEKVSGVQLAGLLNIADSSDYPIGLINLIKNGEKSVSLTTDEVFTTLLGFRSGGRVLYGIIGAGYNFKTGRRLYALEAGFGAHIPVTGRFRFNGEAAFQTLSDFHRGEYFSSTLRFLAAWRPVKAAELFAGPSFSHIQYTHDMGKGLRAHYTWNKTVHGRFFALAPGLVAGVQVNF